VRNDYGTEEAWALNGLESHCEKKYRQFAWEEGAEQNHENVNDINSPERGLNP
jgi:hypothetical protein